MRLFLVCLVLLSCLAGEGRAATPAPTIEPAPDWVSAVPIPDPDRGRAQAAFQGLLLTVQQNFREGGDEVFIEAASLIQQPQALPAFGTVSIPWQPETMELRIHKIHVVRNGEVRDALAEREFTVLRREGNLEAAKLDGVLTATLPLHDLRVGDTVNIAFSYRRIPGAIAFRSEGLFTLDQGIDVERVLFRSIWPADRPIQWRATEEVGEVDVRRRGGQTELLLDRSDVQGPKPIPLAPPRFALGARIDLSQYSGWEEISSLFAPVYRTAAQIPPDSPIRAEIARIAALSEDPRVRAMAALRLVQDEVRYLALAMGDAGFVPAGVEETWARKYGDCKGKTALLLAILHELGIEAQPVLVNSLLGDSIPERLPQVSAFDHVIVRARIDDRSYWLDGTGLGDRDIEELASSRFRWGLPVRAEGAALEAIPFYPLRQPTRESHLTYDASGGFLGSVPVSGHFILRGQNAIVYRTLLGQLGGDDLRAALAELVGRDDAEGLNFEHSYDEELGTLNVRWSGRQRMVWSGAGEGGRIVYRFDNDTISWHPDFARPEGEHGGAPFLVPVADYHAATETVILPRNGEGMELEAEELDRTVAGVHIRRTISVEDGRAVAYSTFRPVRLEIDAEAAAASAGVLAEINDDVAQLVPTEAFQMTDADRMATQDWKPESANDFVGRGHARMQRGELATAIEDFEQAARLDPDWALPLANHGIALVHRGRHDEAEAMLARAAAIDPNDPYVHQGQGMLQLARGKPVQAVAAFTRSLELEPGNAYSLLQRATAFAQLGEFEDARIDLDSILEQAPDNEGALGLKARILAWIGEEDEALALIDEMVARAPDHPGLLAERAGLLKRFGRSDDAAAAYAAAIAALEGMSAGNDEPGFPLGRLRRHLLADSGDVDRAVAAIDEELRELEGNGRLLNERCWTLATAGRRLEEALGNCDEALALDLEFVEALDSRALVHLRMGDHAAAIADADAALAIAPQLAESLYVRGLARIAGGERRAGERDLAAARRLTFDIDAEYRGYGVTVEWAAAGN